VLELKPGILLLDLKMPSQPKAKKVSPRGGLDAWAAAKGSGSMTKTILFAAEMETEEIVEAIELGVRGVLLNSSATEFLSESIRTVMSGACWEETKAVPNFHTLLRTMREELNKRKFGLTPRELQVVPGIVRHGMSNKEIGHFLKISEDTVKNTSVASSTSLESRIVLNWTTSLVSTNFH